MCGICGQFLLDGRRTLDADELARTSRALARRGPDGEGVWRSADSRVAFGHRRLAILDPTPAGAQPMRSADGRFTLVFNGEIFDFAALRAELVRSGVAFRSASDTEVVIELWRRHGTEALSLLRGMYAFALWDELEGRLTLARDPYGIKPLYWALAGGVLRFASQVRALEAGGALDLAVDRDAVAGFLAWGAVPEPLTLRKAIRALPAGHTLIATRDGAIELEPHPYRPSEPEPESFAAALEESVSAHLVSDVPVALFLSAGVDSASIAALARRAGAAPVALTLGWREAAGTPSDEIPLARATAMALGLEHRSEEIEPDELRAAADEIFAAMDQPSIDGFNSWLVARCAARAGFKVALSGLGGDELLGGYRSFRDVPRWARAARRLDRLPFARRVAPSVARLLAPGRPKLASLLADGGSLAGAYVLRRGLHAPAELAHFDSAVVGSGYDPRLDAWQRLGETTLGGVEALTVDPWRAVHRLESQLYLRNQLLRDADWAGMAHGVEIRVPFVDARLRAALERLGFEPARSRGKAAALRTVVPELPAALFDRAKSGFQLPIADWLDGVPPDRRRPIAAQSRRLAQIALERFGIEVEELGRPSARSER